MRPKFRIKDVVLNSDGLNIKRRYQEFNGGYCWVCGKFMRKEGKLDQDKATMHHLIPKCLNPVSNVVAPICHSCHKLIHNIVIDTDSTEYPSSEEILEFLEKNKEKYAENKVTEYSEGYTNGWKYAHESILNYLKREKR